MKTLAIDTSTPRGSLALLDSLEVVGEMRLRVADTHSARLLPGLELLLAGTGWKLAELELVAVGIGPGSFTGIRIGVATALGLAQTLGCPLASVSGMDALAHAVVRAWDPPAGSTRSRALGIVMDAGRGQVYYGGYRASRGAARASAAPRVVAPDDLGRRLGRTRVWLAGDGARRYVRELGITRTGPRRLVDVDLFLATPVGRLAQTRRRVWQRGDFLTAEPLYIRPPDAVLKRYARDNA